MRKLGLDLGTKTCGIAISDEKAMMAFGLENFSFPEKQWQYVIDKIKELEKEYKLDKIIIGYPTFASGDKTKTAILIDEFIELLNKEIKIEVIKVDENKSTKEAKNIFIESNSPRKKTKQLKDKVAAQIILTNYLNMHYKGE